MVIPKKRLSLCRDKEDDMVLECCLSADADILITGDKDLLEMEKTILKPELPKLCIVSPGSFLRCKK